MIHKWQLIVAYRQRINYSSSKKNYWFGFAERVFNVDVEVSDLTLLADNRLIISCKSGMSLGAEIVYELLRLGQICSQSSKFLLQNTMFGHVTSGCEEQVKVHCELILEDDLNKTLKKFWK